MANETEQTLRRMKEVIEALEEKTLAIEQRVATLERRQLAVPIPETTDDGD